MTAMMDKARELFDAATSIARPLREAYVRRHASGDEALMNEVLRLLEFDEPTTETPGKYAQTGLAARGSPGPGGPFDSSKALDASAGNALVKGYRLIERQENWAGGELWLAEPEDMSPRAGGPSAAQQSGGMGRGPGLGIGPGKGPEIAPGFARGLSLGTGPDNTGPTIANSGGRVFVSVLPRPDSIRAALSRWKLVRPQLDALTGPVIARTVDAGRTSDDRLFLVMPVFLPLSLSDWLQFHAPNSAEMLTVVTRLEAALAELAEWGLLHGNLTASSIRLRVAPKGGPASPESGIEVQLVGAGVTQIVASHTALGRALSVKADRASLANIAALLAGVLIRRSQPTPTPATGRSPAASHDSSDQPSGQPPAPDALGISPGLAPLEVPAGADHASPHGSLTSLAPASLTADRAFMALARLGEGALGPDGDRPAPASAVGEDSSLLPRRWNRLRPSGVYSLAAAFAGAAVAATLGSLGVGFFGGTQLASEHATGWGGQWFVPAIAVATLAGSAVSCVALVLATRERK